MNLSQFLTRWRVYTAFIFLFTLILIISFALRGMILRKAINSINAKLRNHQYVAHWDGSRFKGLKTVFVKGIYIQHRSGGNEVYIDSIAFHVRIAPLFFKQVRIRKLDCKAISIRYYSGDSANQSSPVIQEDSTRFLDRVKGINLAEFTNKNIRRFFGYTPARINIDRMEVRLLYAGNTTVIGLRDFRLAKGKMSAKLRLTGNLSSVEIPLAGRFDKAGSVIEVHLVNADSNLLPVPVLRDRYGVAAGFDSLAFMMNLAHRNRHLVNIDGSFSFTGFELNGERIATDNISIDHFRSSFRVNIGPDYFEIDSTTQAYLNHIKLNPYFRFLLGNEPEVDFKLLPARWNAEDFFSSLPEGMFTSLTGLKTEGTLHYFLNFSVNLNNPDSLKFNTKLTADDFIIRRYGADDYRMLNGSFYHRAYEHGKLVATFKVGPDNPDFVPFEQISSFLRAAVMTSEDGSFFYHNGFNPNAFRESIVANIKEKRFARGGSTISMQLVKNVFLTRNKTLARKIEEAIIVWLIENENLISKQRMYEVYLNIIEWGPGIYGINQASRFYFDKPPAGLNLQESVYLASIVPHPKWYKYTFESNGTPRPFFGNYFNRLKDLMVRKGFISPGDTTGVIPMVLLTGPAAQAFVSIDTIATDSVSVEDLEIMPSF
jgi:hypothetical protein